MGKNQFKTVFLLSLLSGLLLFIGYVLGGNSGVFVAFIFSIGMNFFAYFYSDKYVLKSQNAQPLNQEKYPKLYEMVSELAKEYEIPMPKMWLIPTKAANAFATGRNPKNGHVAVTQGILEILEPHELRGVLAHELGHIKNRDILVSSVAATLAGAIGMIANTMRWQGYAEGNQKKNAGALLIALFMPMAASLLHLGISRSREYMADESGAHASHDPMALASALQKLDSSAKRMNLIAKNPAEATTASLYIVYPFSTKSLTRLFSTHPPMEDRIARLRQMAKNMKSG